MYEGETIVCEGVVCEEIVKQLCMGVNELRAKELCVKELRAKILCLCEKAGPSSDTVESTTGRPAITRMRTDWPVPLCVPSKAH